MKKILACMALSVGLASTPTYVFAQPADEAAAGKVPVARRLYDEGVQAVSDGRWSVAHDKFKASYDLSPRVLTLFNLAGAQAQTSRPVDASESYRRFLRETQDGRYPELRAEATAALDTLEKQIAQVRFAVTGISPGDVIAIDGTEIPQSALGEPFPMNPGPHVVIVRRNGAQITSQSVTLAPGAADTVKLEVPKNVNLQLRSVDGPGARGPDYTTSPKRDDDRSIFASPWFWGAVVLVAAAGGGAYYFATRPEDGVLVVR